MNKIFILIVIILFVGAGVFLIWHPKQRQDIMNISPTHVPTQNTLMKITSQAFGNNQPIPKKYTCDGENINPPLTIENIPDDAKSLVLIVDDPDATSGTWTHWTVWNIDPKTSTLPENSKFTGANEGKTSFGKTGYGGPCPPSGTHHYRFSLYALNETLQLSSSANVSDLKKAMENQIVSNTELVGLYSRK